MRRCYKNLKVNHIYLEDCRKTLEKIHDNQIDVVVTSPPYNMNLRIRNGKYCSRQIVKEFSNKYENFNDNLPIDNYNKLHTDILKELLRVSNLVFYNVQIVTGSKKSIFKMIGEMSDYLKEIIVWDKGHAQPAMQSQVLNRRTELILVFEKDNSISRQFQSGKFERGTVEDIWQIKRDKTKYKNHGAVFPIDLIKKILLNFTEENDLIYDPFMGLGTTAVAAKATNRCFLGSEINKNYIEVANHRLSQIQTDIFYDKT